MSLRDDYARTVDLDEHRRILEDQGANQADVDASVADLERRRKEQK